MKSPHRSGFTAPGGSLGHEADNLICLPDGTVSARRAYFSSDGQSERGRDLKSRNKAKLDGAALDAGLLGGTKPIHRIPHAQPREPNHPAR